tara:strand:- start:30 stop:266 length:237 start_codon:yes stop_codon:yes gene_type:complete
VGGVDGVDCVDVDSGVVGTLIVVFGNSTSFSIITLCVLILVFSIIVFSDVFDGIFGIVLLSFIDIVIAFFIISILTVN